MSKLNSTGSALVYSTYLGGNFADYGYGIAVDSSGNAYVTGNTNSSNFPTTTGAFQTTLAGSKNAFVSKLNSGGSALLYSTYLGGSSSDFGQGLAVDSSGNAYVAGYTYSSNFPTTTGAFQTTLAGSRDAFVSKLNSTGSALLYSTYLGGSSDDSGQGIAVDSSGNASVTGLTESSNFPTTTGAFQTTFGGGTANAFVSKLNSGGSALLYSTYLGGSGDDLANGIAVDSSGNAYVTGVTFSSNFPTTTGAFQTTLAGSNNAFISKLNLPNSIMFASFTGKLQVTVSTGSFDLTSSFTLGAGTSGINPVAQPVTLQIGPYSVTIPPGSFKLNKGAYAFQGVINGVSLQLRINPAGGNKYTLQAEGSGANLTGISNPVTVTLTIGNDSGSTAITAQIS